MLCYAEHTSGTWHTPTLPHNSKTTILGSNNMSEENNVNKQKSKGEMVENQFKSKWQMCKGLNWTWHCLIA